MIRRLGLLLLLATPIQAASPLQGRTIALDPGHGTMDFQGHIINSGKSNRDGKLNEHRITFDIVQKLGKMIEEEGGRVIYTRTPFDYWRLGSSSSEDNKARALLANQLNADVFISIHCDWDPRQRMKGTTTFYRTPVSEKLATYIQTKLIRDLKSFDREVKRDSYTVLDVASMPAVLVETGFLSNRSEAKKLSNSDYQQKIAQSITSALNNYFAN